MLRLILHHARPRAPTHARAALSSSGNRPPPVTFGVLPDAASASARPDGRRRRKRARSPADGEAAAAAAVPFSEAVPACFDRVAGAMGIMGELNEGFEVTRDDASAELSLYAGPAHGEYRLVANAEEQCMSMISPVSGGNTYVRDAASGRWVSRDDGHDMEGLIVRDMLRTLRGVPEFS